MNEKNILLGYEYAKEAYAAAGVDVDAAIRKRRCPHYGWTLEIVRLIYRLAQ